MANVAHGLKFFGKFFIFLMQYRSFNSTRFVSYFVIFGATILDRAYGDFARPKYHFLASGTERGQKVVKRRRVRCGFLTAVVKRCAEASRAGLAVVSDALGALSSSSSPSSTAWVVSKSRDSLPPNDNRLLCCCWQVKWTMIFYYIR